MSGRTWKYLRGVVLVVPSALLLAACSSSGSSPGTGASGASGSGGTITIGFIGSLQSSTYNFPETAAAAQAYVDAANASGGINGKTVKLVVCNDQTDANQAVACVQQMTTDGAVGVIGGVSSVGDNITAGLQAAGLVYTGERPLSPGESNSPISFPMVGGAAADAAGLGDYAATGLGCKEPFSIVADTSPAELSAQGFAAGYKAGSSGGSVGQTTTPATSSSYFSAAAAAAAHHADCIFLTNAPTEIPKVVPAIKAALPNAKILDTAGGFPPSIVQALGSQANGVYLSDCVVPTSTTGNATLDQFKADMAKYEPSGVQDGFAITSWLGTRLLLDTIGKISGPVTGPTVLKAFDNLGEVDSGGVIGNFNFKSPPAVSDSKRVFNNTYLVYEYDNGKYTVTSGGFKDAAALLK
jgi:branched-chain amino acid transport system substrate-binding protein